MARVNTQEQIRKVEVELESLKRLVGDRQPDFNVDEKNWASLKKEVKSTRKKNYRKAYGSK